MHYIFWIANFVYSNINPDGGGEQFTLLIMQATLILILILILILNLQLVPRMSMLENAYGKGLTLVLKKVKKFNVLQMFNEENINEVTKKAIDQYESLPKDDW
ncbi:MAG: hypothetical protein M3Q77_06950 [Thermoproteota archaeon]|nr:hypothetical protein [Nitrosopumilus sp.]MDQ3084538.1 hypothetical protein [Thermoproteota archaeon]